VSLLSPLLFPVSIRLCCTCPRKSRLEIWIEAKGKSLRKPFGNPLPASTHPTPVLNRIHQLIWSVDNLQHSDVLSGHRYHHVEQPPLLLQLSIRLSRTLGCPKSHNLCKRRSIWCFSVDGICASRCSTSSRTVKYTVTIITVTTAFITLSSNLQIRCSVITARHQRLCRKHFHITSDNCIFTASSQTARSSSSWHPARTSYAASKSLTWAIYITFRLSICRILTKAEKRVGQLIRWRFQGSTWG
jgi:hypothetical protein